MQNINKNYKTEKEEEQNYQKLKVKIIRVNDFKKIFINYFKTREF